MCWRFVALCGIGRATGAVALTLVLSAVPARAAAPPTGANDSARDPPPGLTFDRPELLGDGSVLAVSKDSKRVAYTARASSNDESREKLADADTATPGPVRGTHILVTDLSTHKTISLPASGKGTAWRPVWSPDGKELAYYCDELGITQLWVYDTDTGQSRRVNEAAVKASQFPGDEPQWSPDGATVFVPLVPKSRLKAASTAQSGDEEAAAKLAQPATVLRTDAENRIRAGKSGQWPASPTGRPPLATLLARLYEVSMGAVDVSTGQVHELGAQVSEGRHSTAALSPSGKWLAYFSVPRVEASGSRVLMELTVAPSAGGSGKTLTRDIQLPDLIVGPLYETCCAWHPKRDLFVYLVDGHLWSVDFDGADAAPRQLIMEPVTSAIFSASGSALLVGLDPRQNFRNIWGGNGMDTSGWALLSVDTGELARLPYDASHWSAPSFLRETAYGALWQPDGKSVLARVVDRASGEGVILKLQPGAERATVISKSGSGLSKVVGSTQGDAFGIYEDFRTPQNVFRFSASFASRTQVSRIESDASRLQPGAARTFQTTVPLYDGRLGKVSTGVITPAGAAAGEKFPAVVMAYPGARLSEELRRYGGGAPVTVPAQVFVQAGFAVVLVDLPMGPANEPGNLIQELADMLLPQVRRAAELGYIDIERVALIGQSAGGYLAPSMLSFTQLFRAGIAINGFFDISGIRYGALRENHALGINWAERAARLGTHPWANLPRYLENSPYYRADKIHTPLLIVHGAEDDSRPQAEMLYTALKRLDRAAELAVYPGEGHVISNWNQLHAVDAAWRMVEFLESHIQGR